MIGLFIVSLSVPREFLFFVILQSIPLNRYVHGFSQDGELWLHAGQFGQAVGFQTLRTGDSLIFRWYVDNQPYRLAVPGHRLRIAGQTLYVSLSALQERAPFTMAADTLNQILSLGSPHPDMFPEIGRLRRRRRSLDRIDGSPLPARVAPLFTLQSTVIGGYGWQRVIPGVRFLWGQGFLDFSTSTRRPVGVVFLPWSFLSRVQFGVLTSPYLEWRTSAGFGFRVSNFPLDRLEVPLTFPLPARWDLEVGGRLFSALRDTVFRVSFPLVFQGWTRLFATFWSPYGLRRDLFLARFVDAFHPPPRQIFYEGVLTERGNWFALSYGLHPVAALSAFLVGRRDTLFPGVGISLARYPFRLFVRISGKNTFYGLFTGQFSRMGFQIQHLQSETRGKEIQLSTGWQTGSIRGDLRATISRGTLSFWLGRMETYRRVGAFWISGGMIAGLFQRPALFLRFTHGFSGAECTGSTLKTLFCYGFYSRRVGKGMLFFRGFGSLREQRIETSLRLSWVELGISLSRGRRGYVPVIRISTALAWTPGRLPFPTTSHTRHLHLRFPDAEKDRKVVLNGKVYPAPERDFWLDDLFLPGLMRIGVLSPSMGMRDTTIRLTSRGVNVVSWPAERVHLSGRVVDRRGKPVTYTVIIVEGKERKYKVITDWEGEFSIDLPPGRYTLRFPPLRFAHTVRIQRSLYLVIRLP